MAKFGAGADFGPGVSDWIYDQQMRALEVPEKAPREFDWGSPDKEKTLDLFERGLLDELPAETPQMAAERDVGRAQRAGRNLRFEPGQQMPFKAKKIPAPTVGDYFRFLWEGISTGMGLF